MFTKKIDRYQNCIIGVMKWITKNKLFTWPLTEANKNRIDQENLFSNMLDRDFTMKDKSDKEDGKTFEKDIKQKLQDKMHSVEFSEYL